MQIEVRPASLTDAAHLSRFRQIAAGGLIDALYADLVPGKSADEAAEHVFARKESTKFYSNARIGLADGRIAGGINMYRADDPRVHWTDPLVPNERRAVLEPFAHLPAAGLYIDFVGVYPEFRGHGIGRVLMAGARSEAAKQDLSLLSLHVFEENEGAVRLYRSLGFEIVRRRPVVPHARMIYGGDMALMVCQV
jgi:ribosomal protein S18 acetylase RimI-like enzyme